MVPQLVLRNRRSCVCDIAIEVDLLRAEEPQVALALPHAVRHIDSESNETRTVIRETVENLVGSRLDLRLRHCDSRSPPEIPNFVQNPTVTVIVRDIFEVVKFVVADGKAPGADCKFENPQVW